MAIHLTATRERIMCSVRIELSKKIFHRRNTNSKHPGLVAVIPGSPIPFVKSAGKGHLWHFFPVTDDTEFGFTTQDFFAAKDTGLAAHTTDPIIGNDFADEFIFLLAASSQVELFNGNVPEHERLRLVVGL